MSKAATCLGVFLLASCVGGVAIRAGSGLSPNIAPVSGGHRKRSPPVFPDQYTVSYNFTLPYTAAFLPEAITYPVRLWVNRKDKKLRMDTYNGLDTELDLEDHSYTICPRMNTWVCRVDGQSPGLAADAQRSAVPRLSKGGLPELDEWEYGGEVVYQGTSADKWVHVHRDELKISQYEFLVSTDGAPLRLHMLGSEIVTGAHFDEYLVEFTYYQPFLSRKDAFDVPDLCKGPDAEIAPPGEARRPMSIHFAALIPDVHLGPSEYSDFAKQHGRTHTDAADASTRAALFHRHSTLIKQHNTRPAVSHTLALNKFADWTDLEYGALLGYRSTKAAEAAGALKSGTLRTYSDFQRHAATRKYKPAKGWVPLPSEVDWRGSGAVGAVKDQAVCGSCWTFSASQAMSAAWWLATGDFVSLSEQQVMDCSWKYGTNEACDGGDPDMAMLYVVENGGAFAEEDWTYRGEDDFCKTAGNRSLGPPPRAFFTEIVSIDTYDEKSVREALYLHGPLSIGVDANPIDFRFYSSGVLWSEECSSDPYKLDHAVMLVGYGEENGQPYWIVKNEWSAHWGDGGYIRINRHKDCGVASDAVFPVADPVKVAEYFDRKANEEAGVVQA